MWQPLIDHFRRFPAQERVVRLMLRNGLRIQNGTICSGDIEIADAALGRAASVDRRVVRSTIETIMADPELMSAFSRLVPALDLREVAGRLGGGVVEITSLDAEQPGILAAVSAVFAQARIPIRQSIVEDPGFIDDPKLLVVTQSPVPPHVVPLLQKVTGVKSVQVR